jgi:hypothetical protein
MKILTHYSMRYYGVRGTKRRKIVPKMSWTNLMGFKKEDSGEEIKY